MPVLDHQVRRSNSYGLAASLRLAGFPPATDLHLPDQRPAAGQSGWPAEIDRHDVLVLSGGVSAGRHDYVPAVLAEIGVRRVFHQVAQRPGRPLWFGVNDRGVMVFALPGNPVSVLVCLARYVIPALLAAAGARVLLAPDCRPGPGIRVPRRADLFPAGVAGVRSRGTDIGRTKADRRFRRLHIARRHGRIRGAAAGTCDPSSRSRHSLLRLVANARQRNRQADRTLRTEGGDRHAWAAAFGPAHLGDGPLQFPLPVLHAARDLR